MVARSLGRRRCGAIVAVRYRRDPALLAVTLLPQLAAVVGYAFWLADLEAYYYVSLMPAAVLTVVLGVSALVPRRMAAVVGCALLVGALSLVPARLQFAATLFRMPQYETFVRASRAIVRSRQPMRAIRAGFPYRPPATPSSSSRFLAAGSSAVRRGGRRSRLTAGWCITRPTTVDLPACRLSGRSD